MVIGCIGSLVSFLRGLVCFPTCLTGWINSFWLSFSSVAFLVDVVNVVRFVIWDRAIGATFFIARIFLSFSGLFFFAFSFSSTDFYNVTVFYSGGTLVWVCRRLCLQCCGSHYLIVTR